MTMEALRHRFWRGVGHQLRCPSGFAGSIAGHMMSLVNRDPVRLAVRALDPRPGEDILELGFGSGAGLSQICRHAQGGSVFGIDRSPTMLALATRRNRPAVVAGRIVLETGDFEAIDKPSGSFDAALLVNVVYFFDTAGRAMREVHRLLRPGGRVAIYATDRQTMNRWPFCEPDTHRTFDQAAMRELLLQGGFGMPDICIEAIELPFGIGAMIALASKT
jgi:ubiquinone/menaquinone biosynthesis C-methylase UbiE